MKKSMMAVAASSCVLAAGFSFVKPAAAERTVMVMMQEMPADSSMSAASSGINIEMKLDPATMAALHDDMVSGKIKLSCTPTGAVTMMCHGK